MASQKNEQARAEAESLGRDPEASCAAEVWEAIKPETRPGNGGRAQQGVIPLRTLLSHSTGSFHPLGRGRPGSRGALVHDEHGGDVGGGLTG
jgi:hypothetical protein